MQGNGRYSVARRLLAATLSLVLVLSSMIGAHAHAMHDAHHHEHGVHLLVDGVPEPSVSAADDEAKDNPNPGAKHTSCADLLCHGGFAILSGQADRQYLERRSIALVPRNETSSGSRQSSLDRPPRLSILV